MLFRKKFIIITLALTITTALIMGLFSFFKKSSDAVKVRGPYKDSSINLIYSLLFCDDISLYKSNTSAPPIYPFDILYSETSTVADFQKIIDDSTSDARLKILAYNEQRKQLHKPVKKELLAVIVEMGLDNGTDVLASFKDGTARYINHTGKLLVWETTNKKSNVLTQDLFAKSIGIVEKIGPWDKARLPSPTKGNVRITFLVSDGLYFGEGAIDVLFNDPMAGPALTSAAQLMQYLTQATLQNQ